MTPEAERMYAAVLAREHGRVVARDREGNTVELASARWLAAAGPTDERVLARARGPVLDVGCGPGRHVRALRRSGVAALGLDASPAAVRMARTRGTPVVEGSVFDDVPAPGAWSTVLLLDGNVGIGGDPQALLHRAGQLLAAEGAVLCECEAPGTGLRAGSLRLEHGGASSHWFPWARVDFDALVGIAGAAGLTARERWEDGGRWFAWLQTG